MLRDEVAVLRRQAMCIDRCWSLGIGRSRQDLHGCSPASISAASSARQRPCGDGTGTWSPSTGPGRRTDPASRASRKEPPRSSCGWRRGAPTGAAARPRRARHHGLRHRPLEHLGDLETLRRRAVAAPIGADLRGVPHAQAKGLMLCDFFDVDTVFFCNLYVLALIDHDSRRLRIAGVTAEPVSGWVTQQTRNLLTELAEHATAAKSPRPRPRHQAHLLLRRRPLWRRHQGHQLSLIHI